MRFLRENTFTIDAAPSIRDILTHYEVTETHQDIVSMRENYFKKIQRYRQDGYNILCQDETWVFNNMCSNKACKDTQGGFAANILKFISGIGDRSILSEVNWEEIGLLEGCMLLYGGSKDNKCNDFYSELNGDVLSKWCTRTVFPAIVETSSRPCEVPENSV